MRPSRLCCIAGILAIIGATASAAAESAAEKGYRLAKQAADNSAGYRDFIVSGRMILRDSAGNASERTFDLKAIESRDGDKTLLVFNWPGDIRDAALLTHSSSTRDDNQWIYLPSVSRAKRISGSGRSGSFVGSEFSYEDMVNQDVDKFNYEWIADQPCRSEPKLKCHVVDRIPKFQSGYSRERVMFDTSQLRVLTVDFYDRRGALVKTLTAAGYRLYRDKFWRADILRMENHLTGKSSDLAWSNFRFGVGLVDAQFSVSALENVR